MRKLSDSVAMREARRFKTLMLSRAVGGGGAGVAMPQPTAQNQMVIANATPAWMLLAAPTDEFQVPIAGADPYTPAWAALTVEAISDLAYATPALTLSISNAEGAADTVIRSDATILVFDATVPNTIEPDDAASAGSATVSARRDHEHAIVCAAPASPSVSLAASAEGAGTSFARADHTHQLDQAIVPTWTGLHTFTGGVYLVGASEAVRTLTVLDGAAPALRLLDTGNTEYLRIISTNAQPVIVFNEGGADVDHRWEASGQENALFVEGSTGHVGGKTNSPAADWHIVGSTVSNKHYSAHRTQILEDNNTVLQLIGDDLSTGMAHVVFTAVPTSGDNKHWVVSHLGPDANNRFSVGYMTSSADDFIQYTPTELFVILTDGKAGFGLTNPASIVTVGANPASPAALGVVGTVAVTAAEIQQTGTGNILNLRNVSAAVMIVKNGGQVALGTTTPATSALLDLTSTTGSLLLSRMTTTQRNALTAVNGMVLYNTTTTRLEAYENGAWVDL